MKAPKKYTEEKNNMTEEMKRLEKERPFNFPTKGMSAEEKAQWDAWAAKWNAACTSNGMTSLTVIYSEKATI